MDMQIIGHIINIGLICLGHLFMVGVVLVLAKWLATALFTAENNSVKLLRMLAMVAGVFIAYISKYANLSYSDFIIEALGFIRFRYLGIEFFDLVVPGIAGLLAGFIFTRLYRKGGERATQVCLLFGAMAFLLFVFSYGYIIEDQAFFDMSVILPNFCFIVGVIIVIVFFSDKKTPKEKKKSLFGRQGSDDDTILL
jgi:hypothetical protein